MQPEFTMDIDYVCDLARLELSPEEKEAFAAQLPQILEFVQKIRELDLRDVEPMAHPLPLTNVTRKDEVGPGLSLEEALQNAPQAKEGLFLVPKVIE